MTPFWRRLILLVELFTYTTKDIIMKWQTPTATDMRFGFEITMYIANR